MTSPHGAVIPGGYSLCPLQPGDAEPLAAAYHRNREHLEPWDPVRPEDFYTVDGQQEAVSRQLSLVRGGLLATWVIWYADDVAGRVSLNNIARGVLASATVGYWVDEGHLHQGLATAAVEHACAEAMALGLHRVEAGTMLRNVASQRVLLRAGFELYGMAPKLLFVGGGWQDHKLYQRILHDNPL